MSDTERDLPTQPRPTDSHCPDCGEEPTDESITKRNLSELGYTHEDVHLECRACATEWTCGIPIGEFDRPELAAELRCDSCDSEWGLVHRVAPHGSWVRLHLKCPGQDCVNFWRVKRTTGPEGRALVGYPQITGQTEGCEPYGYPADEGEDDVEGTSEGTD